MTDKKAMFDRLANELGFETVAGSDRNARLRYAELVRVYDRLKDLGEITKPRNDRMTRADLRDVIAEAVGYPDAAGRPITKPVLKEVVTILCSEEVVADGGSVAAATTPTVVRSRPTQGDLERAEEFDYVYPWVEVEECVCVSRKQNSTAYHTRWLVSDDGELRPACNGFRPEPERDFRLVEEASISRTKRKCEYCAEEERSD